MMASLVVSIFGIVGTFGYLFYVLLVRIIRLEAKVGRLEVER